MTPKELANKIGVHFQTVHTWKRKYNMPCRQKVKRGNIDIDFGEFLAWWQGSKTSGTI